MPFPMDAVFYFQIVYSPCRPLITIGTLQVKVLYARNLTQECTEDALKQAFETYGKIERVKKIKDYAFIHFEERENALKVG